MYGKMQESGLTEIIPFFEKHFNLIFILYWSIVDLQLCYFQVHSVVIQLHMYPFFFRFFSHVR